MEGCRDIWPSVKEERRGHKENKEDAASECSLVSDIKREITF